MQSILDLIKGGFEKIILGFAKIVGEETALQMSGFIAGSIIIMGIVLLIQMYSCYEELMCDNYDLYEHCNLTYMPEGCWDTYCE
jgi:hypothetical protein